MLLRQLSYAMYAVWPKTKGDCELKTSVIALPSPQKMKDLAGGLEKLSGVINRRLQQLIELYNGHAIPTIYRGRGISCLFLCH